MTDRYASLKQGLVGCWIPSVSGSGLLLPDLSGRGNSGSLVGMDASDWVSASYGRALDFDGTDDRVDISNESNFDFERTAQFSVTFWARLNTLSPTAQVVASKLNPVAPNEGWEVRFFSPFPGVDSNAINFILGNNVSGGNFLMCTAAVGSLAVNQWLHIGVTYNGSSTASGVNLFLSGQRLSVTVNTDTLTASILNDLQVRIGQRANSSNTFPLNGQLDDIRIYNRALTEPEIRVLASEPGIGFKPAKKLSRFSQRFTYKPAKPRNYSVIRNRDPNYSTLRQGLVAAYCPSISGQGNVLPDLVGGNHGTLTNMDASDWVSSGDGRALDFDGVNDYVTFGNKAGDIVGPITVSAWVYMPTLLVSPNNGGILAKGNIRQAWPGTSYCLSVLGDSPQNTVSWAVFDDANNGRIGYFSSDGIAARTWTHVCGTYDGTGTTNAATKLYIQSILKSINGSEDAGTFVSMTTTTVDLEIGRRPFDASFQYAPIVVDDVRIYNRVLSLTEIKLLASKRGIGLEPRKPKITFTDLGVQKTYSVVRVKETDYATLRQGLVGAWCPSLPSGGSGNTLPDVSGFNNHGVLTNMGPEDWVSSQYGRALDFDGTNDFVLVSNNNALNFGTGAFSVCAWVNATNPIANLDAIFGKDSFSGGSSYTGYLLNVSGTGPKWAFETRNVVSGSGPDTQLLSATNARTGWTHIVGVRESTSPSTLRLYVNGVLDNSTNEASSTNVSNITAATIGVLNESLLSQYLNGQLDDIRIYNRALSESEIRLLASRPGIGLRQESHRNTFYQFPSGARRKRILTGMP